MKICRVHKHSSEKSAARCAEKMGQARARRSDRRMESAGLPFNPVKHVVVTHPRPRLVTRGGWLLMLVWSEATVLPY